MTDSLSSRPRNFHLNSLTVRSIKFSRKHFTRSLYSISRKLTCNWKALWSRTRKWSHVLCQSLSLALIADVMVKRSTHQHRIKLLLSSVSDTRLGGCTVHPENPHKPYDAAFPVWSFCCFSFSETCSYVMCTTINLVYYEQEIRSVELGVCPLQLFHFWSRGVHPVQNLLLCTKFHRNRMIYCSDMAI